MEEVKKDKSKKRVKKTETIRKHDWSKLKLMTIDENDKFEIVEVPIKLKWQFVEYFGLITIPNKQDLLNWLNSQNV